MNLEIKEELLKRVDSINNKFSVYKNFSPDELRKTLRNIESSITSSGFTSLRIKLAIIEDFIKSSKLDTLLGLKLFILLLLIICL